MTYSGAVPAIQWTAYSGPGVVTFANAALTNTTANFSVPGIYSLELSADDGVHAVAYAVVNVNVINGIRVAITQSGAGASLSWAGGTGPYVVQQTTALPMAWSDLLTTSGNQIDLPITGTTVFFRVRGQ